MKFSNRLLFELDDRHVEKDDRWKSSADPYHGKQFCLRTEIEEWLKEHNIESLYGESTLSRHIPCVSTLYFFNANDAMMFKLTWL